MRASSRGRWSGWAASGSMVKPGAGPTTAVGTDALGRRIGRPLPGRRLRVARPHAARPLTEIMCGLCVVMPVGRTADVAGPRERCSTLNGNRFPCSVTVNGEAKQAAVEPRMLLVHLLREQFGLTGTHVGCDTSQCGACTIHLNGRAVKSCTIFAVQAEGAEITTIEGLAHGTPAAPGAGRLPPEARPAVRLLHARHGHDRARTCCRRIPRPRTTRSSTRSKATSAAAPATSTSSKRSAGPRRR